MNKELEKERRRIILHKGLQNLKTWQVIIKKTDVLELIHSKVDKIFIQTKFFREKINKRNHKNK